ncbi:hypothetical protein IAR55_005374 [Kwoniella newhampshirensis]|uniref:Asteroid domain-containing protein n=1 Tax=Kwoniella newhampshirensis TaxID=1651941 RepID=A0AAW0YVS3_9TREE
MGVRGLQTFIKENRNSLCRSVILPEFNDVDGQGAKGKTPVVIDAWGIVYKLYLDSLPWTSGGEYLRLYKLVNKLVKAWRKVGLEPTFVFDGAAPPEKHDELLRRFSEQLLTCQLFYTTSKYSRSSSSFSRTTQRVVLPPFASHAFLFALRRLDVAIHIAPQGEADGVCVSLANQLGGYVLGQDSDFVIMIGRVENVKGYVPLDMMMWIEGENAQNSRHSSPSDDSFQPVNHGRSNQATMVRQSALLPQPSYSNPTLVLTVVLPQTLRQRLRLPPHYMPLFASLCGNDYTPTSTLSQFFESNLDTVQRVEKAARILREQLFSPTANAKSSTNPGDQVVELVKRVIKKLTVYPLDTEQALQDMVDIIIDAALQYAIPPGGECCSIFPFCGECTPTGCQTAPQSKGEGADDDLHAARMAYAAAQRRGYLNTVITGWLYPDRTYLWGVLEDPTIASLRTSELARRIRAAAWGIADEGLGGLRWPEEEEEQEQERDAGNESVDTADSTVEDEAKVGDRALRNLLGVDGSENSSEVGEGVQTDNTTLVDTDVISNLSASRVVTEYGRQGSSSRLIAYQLELPATEKLSTGKLPTCLRPLEERLRAYLAPLSSDTPLVRALPTSLQPLVAVVRSCIFDCAGAGKSTTSRWRRDEVTAVLRAAVGTLTMWRKDLSRETKHDHSGIRTKARLGESESKEGGMLYPMLESRNAQLVAQISSTMVDTHLLAQSLLLLPTIPSGGITSVEQIGPTHLIPFLFFSGVTIHQLLSETEPDATTGWRWDEEEQSILEKCWNALIDGLEDDVIVGMNHPPAVKVKKEGEGGKQEGGVGGAVDSEVLLSKKERKAKRRSEEKENRKDIHSTLIGGGGASGRFGLLGDLTI